MKITNIKLVAITAFAFSSLLMGCSEYVYDGAWKPSLQSQYLIISPRDFEFGNGEETKTGSITSENAWSFTSVPSWLSLSPSNGNSDADFTIASKTNESVSNREAVFYVSTNNTTSKIQRTLTASQTGASPYISFPEYSSSTITIEGKSDYLIIDVNSNIPDLTATFSQSWASATYNSETKTVNVEIQANETNSSRNGILTVSSLQYSKTAKLTISQLASGVTVLEGIAMSYDADGGKQTRTIKSDLPWTAQTNYSWIEFSPKSGNAGETTMTITTLPSYESDKRIGQIYFYFGDTKKKYIGITQAGRYLTTTPNKITLSADENSSEKITIDSNISWELSTCPEWLTLSQNKGDAGISNITITAQKNNSLNSRSATIVIQDSQTGGITSSITVTQIGLDFGDNTTLEFSWHQSSINLDIPLPGTWNAAVSDGWITLSEYTGSGNKTIMVYVSKNESENLRSGKILFTSEGKTIEIVVVQSGQYINLDNTSSEFSAMGGSLTLTVASSVNTEWEIEYSNNDKSWVQVEKISEEEYTLNVEYNPSSLARSATFILRPTDKDVSEIYAPGVKLSIKQSGRDISCETSKISVFASGGTSQTYKISADGNYSIEKKPEDTWYTVVSDPSTQTFYIVVTDNTSNSDRTGHIILSLSELPNGESVTRDIEVYQYKSGIHITFDDYDEDAKW
ncbi:MAG: hypothetical protein NC453_20355 [Muribaculum sp.]|nr:hypothetical protein [Muribaculum sp.]